MAQHRNRGRGPDRLGRPPLDHRALREAALAAWAAAFAQQRPGESFAKFSAGLTTTAGRWHGHARVELIRPGDTPSEHQVFAVAELDPETLAVLRLDFALDGPL